MAANFHSVPVVVAVPVKDEEERIANCLAALSAQRAISGQHIVLLLNNCTDRTAAVIRAIAPSLPVTIHSLEVSLPTELAYAGYARRLVMELAASLVASDGVLLTTDADAIVDPSWIALNLQALRRGADALAGCIEIDPLEASLIPTRLHEDDARECIYSDLLDKIAAAINPDPFDPLPRHTEHSGASIAVTASAYAQAGGIPAVPLGEDRAFFAALRRIDARIRHAPEVRVIVSGRTKGRAAGGMADTICRRIIRPDETLDERLEPALDAVRRAKLQRLIRSAWSLPTQHAVRAGVLAGLLQLTFAEIVDGLSLPYFGAAWAELEMKSPVLIKRKVPVSDLENQTMLAQAIVDAYYPSRTRRSEPAAGYPAPTEGAQQHPVKITERAAVQSGTGD
ncbi:MAG: glycosyltransferase family A protein [Candidatus Binataceae bacterium]|jgi:GT2 family glycosyltransferase